MEVAGLSDNDFMFLMAGGILFSVLMIGAVCGYIWGMHLGRLEAHHDAR